ncbi:shikimate dehydrogenase [Agromyces ramosus]|uniref:Shikimate dehydrogenase n=1 Tax=Agromyces ramosus TaxID=33879 RepID=A0ABU0R332_9MICO|nr:shikimate dehydrogenase [Agromyces ramosus]MDQ0892491.1 shikimate dehydrogenase [Agromyces ramosus]
MHRLAVLGSPIEHSKSPTLHRAAYAQLGLDWQYTAIDLDRPRLPAFLDTRDESWRGLSLTMPLKQDVLPLLDDVDQVAVQAGAANTVLFDGPTLRGFNTDVGGIVRTLGEHGLDSVHRGLLIGGGATAASALIAMAQLGAAHVRVLVRRPGAASPLQALGTSLGLAVDEAPIADLATADGADLVVSTVPGGTDLGVAASDALARHAVLLDAAYDPWPSRLAAPWLATGGTVVHGLGMLLHQALLQVRVFVNGDQHSPLDDEDAVLAVMRESLS